MYSTHRQHTYTNLAKKSTNQTNAKLKTEPKEPNKCELDKDLGLPIFLSAKSAKLSKKISQKNIFWKKKIHCEHLLEIAIIFKLIETSFSFVS